MTEWSEERMFAAIYRAYGPLTKPANVCLRHVPAYTEGWIVSRDKWKREYWGIKKRYIDALVMTNIQSPRVWAIEVKVTKADLDVELRDLSKSETWSKHAHSFYLAVPPALVDYAKSVIPSAWGVLSVLAFFDENPGHPQEATYVVRRAKVNKEPEPLDVRTWWAMARRAGKQDYKKAVEND